MSEREDDLHLERELREVLRGEIPGRHRTACEGAWTVCRRRPQRASSPARVAAGVIGTVMVAAAAVIVVVALGNRATLDATVVGASPALGDVSCRTRARGS